MAVGWHFYCWLASPAAALGHALRQLPLSLKHLPLQIVESFMSKERRAVVYDDRITISSPELYFWRCVRLCRQLKPGPAPAPSRCV